jgi:hypothetical protein
MLTIECERPNIHWMIGDPIARTLRFIPGGKRTFMEMARYAPNIEPDLRRILEEWDRLQPVHRKGADLDQICRLKGVDPIHFILVVAEAALRFQNTAIVLIAAVNSPAVIDRTVKEALKPSGFKDRQMLLEMYGALPSSRGATVAVVNQIAAKAEINRGSEVDAPRFPTIERTILENDKLIRELQERRRLEGQAARAENAGTRRKEDRQG